MSSSVAERTSSGGRSANADAERVRVAQVVHAHCYVVALVVGADRLETPVRLLVSCIFLEMPSFLHLLGQIDSFVFVILCGGAHAIAVLLGLMVRMLLTR